MTTELLAIPVGGSLRRSLRHALVAIAIAEWDVCEIVPEAWDPDASDDLRDLDGIAAGTLPCLHSLGLNILGDSPSDLAVDRTRAWRRRFGIHVVSDHFAWTGSGEWSLGVFLPPIEPAAALRARASTRRDQLGCELVLENIAVPSRDRSFVLRYHETLVRVCERESIPVLLDAENLALDAMATGAAIEELLAFYRDLPIAGYHVAGGEVVDGLPVDTHRHAVSSQVLDLVRRLARTRSAPIVYERDYALDAIAIRDEVRRLRATVNE